MPVHILRHPVAQDALLALRDHRTPPEAFRRLAHRLSLVLTAAATENLPAAAVTVDSPLEPVTGLRLHDDLVVVPVLRAGLGMLDAALELLPSARVGHIGLARDEHTAVASRYYAKLPPITARSVVLLIDPMLATGGSAVAAASHAVAAGALQIRLLCIVAAPEGIATFEAAHPDIPIHTAAVDRELDARKFILPGLGDFGDRLYGT